MIKNNFPCTCSHPFSEHYYGKFGEAFIAANISVDDDIMQFNGCYYKLEQGAQMYCHCYNYTPDNLKYLEDRYKESL